MKSATSFLAATILFILAVFSLGFIASTIFANRIDRMQRESLLMDARQAALLVSAQDISSLSGSHEDLSNPLYQRIKNQLLQFRATNPNFHYVYILGYRSDVRAEFFYADSEQTSSVDYAPPGQVLGGITDKDIQQFLSGKPYTDGPFISSWGQWISGYAPVISEQGNVVALVGVDIATTAWQNQLTFTRGVIGIIATLLSIIVLVISITYYRKVRSANDLKKQNEKLTMQQGTLKHMQQLAQLGTFTVHFPDGTVTVDQQFLPLFHSTQMEQDVFRTFVHLDDQEKFEAMLKEITTSNIVYSWVDLRIGTQDAGFRKYHIYGNIERHASGPAERFDGVIQDVTDGK